MCPAPLWLYQGLLADVPRVGLELSSVGASPGKVVDAGSCRELPFRSMTDIGSEEVSQQVSNHYGIRYHSGRAKAMMLPPAGRPDLPPPADIATYCLPSIM